MLLIFCLYDQFIIAKLEYQKMRGKSYDAMTTSAEEDEELEDSAQDDDDAEASYRNEKRERSSSARLYVKVCLRT